MCSLPASFGEVHPRCSRLIENTAHDHNRLIHAKCEVAGNCCVCVVKQVRNWGGSPPPSPPFLPSHRKIRIMLRVTVTVLVSSNVLCTASRIHSLGRFVSKSVQTFQKLMDRSMEVETVRRVIINGFRLITSKN